MAARSSLAATVTFGRRRRNAHFHDSLTGTSSLVVGNGGAVVLTTSNTYTGATTVSTGTLQLGTGTAGNDGSLTATSGMTNNGALVYNLAGSQTANYNIIGSGSLTKAGNAGLTLAGANNNYTGTTSVNGGTLNLSGYLNTTGEVMVADAAGAVGTLAVTGTLLANRNANPSLDIGGVTSGVGDLRVFPGAVINTASEFHLGGGATGYGGLTVSGGSITIGSWFLISEGAYGVLNQSGGTINQTGANTVVGCIGSTANIGVANFAGNAAFNTSGTLYLLQNTGANVNGIVSISGSAAVTAAAVQFGGNAVNSGDNGILNLNGGTLATASVLLGSNTGASTWTFNFNGGMLKATAGGNFMNGMTSAYVRSGGGTINNNGLSITIGQSLLAPSGSGVSTTSGLTFGGANPATSTRRPSWSLAVGAAGPQPWPTSAADKSPGSRSRTRASATPAPPPSRSTAAAGRRRGRLGRSGRQHRRRSDLRRRRDHDPFGHQHL